MRGQSSCVAGIVLSAVFALATMGAVQAASGSNVSVKNQYIQVTVANDEFDTGRFTVDTTGGDPGRQGDEGQPLIYGGGKPGTSFATIRVDGKDYVFGGKTQKRAGKSGEFGTPVSRPSIMGGNAISTEYRYGDIAVEQTLSLAESPSTGLMDSVRIEYRVTNTGSSAHAVGTRMLLDTMLGSNDGAPFRIGEQAKATAAVIRGDEIPDFFQAFDSLTQPKVMAQGTLRGAGLTPPDRVYFVEWGTPADDPWSFRFEAGAPFLRKGEGEPDSAAVLFWDPRALSPGETRTYSTIYGLGGISIAPGALAVGITSPTSIECSPKRSNTFLVVAYVDNTGEVKARDVKARLDLPEGLRIAEAPEKSLGDLRSGEIGAARWTVEAVAKTSRTLSFSVAVTAVNTPANVARRTIRVEAPPAVGLTGKYADGVLRATVHNPGPGPLEEVVAKVILPKGLKTAGMESSSKPLGVMVADETVELAWQIDDSSFGSGDAKVFVTSSSTDSAVASVRLSVLPSLKSTAVRLSAARSSVRVGEPFLVDVVVTGATALAELEMDFAYDAARLDLVRVSRGTLLVREGTLLPWTLPDMSKPGKSPGAAAKLIGVGKAEGTVLTLHGIALAKGSATVSMTRIRAVAIGGQTVTLSPQDVKITIQ